MKVKGNSDKNKVIIIGGNHNNTLGLVRSFGKNGIMPYGIIIEKKRQKRFVCKSKYWSKVWTVENEKDAVKMMKEMFANEVKKPVVFLCSDTAAMTVDLNLEELKDRFICPSIGRRQGAIADLMDKVNQVKLAEENQIETAKSWNFDLAYENLPEDLVYPCIFKPIKSAEGKKGDIRIAQMKTDALELLSFYRQIGYKRILIQQYISYKYEILVAGSCDGYNKCAIIARKLRTWPLKTGSTSYAVKEENEDVLSVVDSIFDVLNRIGYSGLVDIELFYADNRIYLNEINFRNTGSSAMAMASGMHYAVSWYYHMIGHKEKQTNEVCNKPWYFMHELFDFQYVRKRKLSYLDWKKDKKKVNAFAFYDKDDLMPYICFQIERVQNRLRGGGKGRISY